jgi:hypothetical protein
MSFNLFDWIREGVKRSVIQGVTEALDSIGSPAGDDGPARLGRLLVPAVEGPPTPPISGGKSRRLGRSLRDVGGQPE